MKSLTAFWLLLRGFNALLDHAQEVAVKRQLGIAAFMPWIKKSLVVIFVVFGVLMIAQSLGADVKAFLAGLGLREQGIEVGAEPRRPAVEHRHTGPDGEPLQDIQAVLIQRQRRRLGLGR